MVYGCSLKKQKANAKKLITVLENNNHRKIIEALCGERLVSEPWTVSGYGEKLQNEAEDLIKLFHLGGTVADVESLLG
jgi:hypothetical protein